MISDKKAPSSSCVSPVDWLNINKICKKTISIHFHLVLLGLGAFFGFLVLEYGVASVRHLGVSGSCFRIPKFRLF